MIKLQLPLRDIFVTQPFGTSYLDFYTKLGMKGHNGIDFRAKDGCPVLATHTGLVTWAGQDGDGGISVTLLSSKAGEGYKTIYYHLKSVNVIAGEKVLAGSIIGFADNTGKYTTGDHLHFGLKETLDGQAINTDNGYLGGIDPSPYFENNWDKSNAYHRYGRNRDWLAEYKMRFKNAWLHRQLIKRGMNPILSGEKINSLVYGAWDFDSIINPAMEYNFLYLTKKEFLDGKKPFC